MASFPITITRTSIGDDVLYQIGFDIYYHLPGDKSAHPFITTGKLVSLIGPQREWAVFHGFVQHVANKAEKHAFPTSINPKDITSINSQGFVTANVFYDFKTQTAIKLDLPTLRIAREGVCFMDMAQLVVYELNGKLVPIGRYIKATKHTGEAYFLLNRNQMCVYAKDTGFCVITLDGKEEFSVRHPLAVPLIVTNDKIVDSMGSMFVKNSNRQWTKQPDRFNLAGQANDMYVEYGNKGPIIKQIETKS